MIAPISKNGRRPDCLVLVDAENFNSREHLEKLVVELPKFGRKLSLQAYGVGQGSRKLFEQYGFEITEKIPTVGRHKNLVDMQLVIEAIEIGLKYRSVKTFVIVSSDGDFVPLAKKLTELGKQVISVCGSPQNLNLHSHVHSTVTIERAEKLGKEKLSAERRVADQIAAEQRAAAKRAATAEKRAAEQRAVQIQKAQKLATVSAQWRDKISAALQGLFGSSRKNKVPLSDLGQAMSKQHSFSAKQFGLTWKTLIKHNLSKLKCKLELQDGAFYLVKS